MLTQQQNPLLEWERWGALLQCAPGRTPYLYEVTLLDAVGIDSHPSVTFSALHRTHWLPKLTNTPQGAILRRFEAWLTLITQRPSLTSHARYTDFEDRPARISLLGEALLRATTSSGKPLLDYLSADPADLVAAAYTYELDHGIRVLSSAEELHPDDRRALAAALDLPSDRAVLLDQMQVLGTEVATEIGAPPQIVSDPSYGYQFFGLVRRAWKLPETTSRILRAFTDSRLQSLVHITPDNPLPGLFLLCEAVQLWKRPMGNPPLIELPEIEVEGLDEGGPEGRYLLREKLTFRLDYRYNDEVLEKTSFDGAEINRRLHVALDRLRIACDAFPDVVVELRLPGRPDERIEVLRIAEAGPSNKAPKGITPTARPATWEALAPGLQAPGDPEALARLGSVFKQLTPEQTEAARRALGKLLAGGKRAPGIREKAVELLVNQFYDDPSTEGRILVFEALLGLAKRRGAKAVEREKAMGGLLSIYGGLPVDAGEKLVAYLKETQAAGGVPEALSVLWKGVLGRHARRAKTHRGGK